MLTDLQKRTAQAIVNVFETGSIRGEYGKVTLLPGDTGHLTYGRAQTTLASGNLYLLLKRYCEAKNASYADNIAPYLKRASKKDFFLDHDRKFRLILELTGNDLIMHEVQDSFFDDVYWLPSIHKAEQLGIFNGLGSAILYDSCVHGSWLRLRDITIDQYGEPSKIGEQCWVKHYVIERRNWLANHPNTLLRRTVYRMKAFDDLIADGKWGLELPFSVRGVVLDETVLLATEPLRISAEDRSERTLLLTSPRLKGEDVKALQRALRDRGVNVSQDGVFGASTDRAVQAFQEMRGLKVDGIVGPITRTFLSL